MIRKAFISISKILQTRMNKYLFTCKLNFYLTLSTITNFGRNIYYILNSKYIFAFEKFITYMSHFDVEYRFRH